VRAHASRGGGTFYGGGRICLRRRHILGERAHQARKELILGGIYLVERRRTSWEVEGAWLGRIHPFVGFLHEERGAPLLGGHFLVRRRLLQRQRQRQCKFKGKQEKRKKKGSG
jgi:hypothetical protein